MNLWEKRRADRNTTLGEAPSFSLSFSFSLSPSGRSFPVWLCLYSISEPTPPHPLPPIFLVPPPPSLYLRNTHIEKTLRDLAPDTVGPVQLLLWQSPGLCQSWEGIQKKISSAQIGFHCSITNDLRGSLMFKAEESSVTRTDMDEIWRHCETK